METKDVQSVGQSLVMGAGLTIFFYIVFAFAPALMLSLSITDMKFDWDKTVKVHRKITLTKEEYPNIYDEDLHRLIEDPIGSNMFYSEEPVDSFSEACVFFFVVFAFLIFIQRVLTLRIRQSWPIIIGWWIISIHPFYYWFSWIMTQDPGPFPGVNWLPSCFFF